MRNLQQTTPFLSAACDIVLKMSVNEDQSCFIAAHWGICAFFFCLKQRTWQGEDDPRQKDQMRDKPATQTESQHLSQHRVRPSFFFFFCRRVIHLDNIPAMKRFTPSAGACASHDTNG